MKIIKNWLPSSSLSFIIYYLLVITIISIPRLNSYYFKSNYLSRPDSHINGLENFILFKSKTHKKKMILLQEERKKKKKKPT